MSSTTAAAVAAPAINVSTYQDKHQAKMAQAFQSDSYFGLISAIKDAEIHRAPNLQISRISTTLTPRWEKTAIFLLLQLDVQVLQAIMDNTLPRRAMTDLRPLVRTVLKTGPMNTAQGDPVIYINWLADKNGCGLCIAEYVEFLDALEVAARIKADRIAPSRQPGGPTIRVGVQDAYARAGASDALVQTDDLAKLRKSAQAFLNQNRTMVLQRAAAQNNTEIMLRAEVGWAIDFQRRALSHSSMSVLSPLLFRVANCVLQYLFPNRGFRMHQFAILNVTDPSEAAVGESILSHIGASYLAYGGFNVSQAGVHVSSAWAASINWRLVTEQAVLNGYFVAFPGNAAALKRHLESKQEYIHKALEWHKTHAAFLEESEKAARATAALESKDRELKGLIFDMEQKVHELRQNRLKAEEAARKRERGMKAMRDLLSGITMAGEDGAMQ